MNDKKQTNTPMPGSKSLGVLSIGSLVLIVAGIVLRNSLGGSALLCTSIGGLLAVAYLVMALIRARKRRAGRTVLSVVYSISLILGSLVGGAVILLSDIGAAMFAPSLAQSLEQSAVGAAIPPQAFLDDPGASGVLPNTKWKDPNSLDSELPIKLNWVRNADGVLVTASPDGTVPSDQSGAPFAQQFVGVDTLGMPLDWYASQAKGDSDFDVFDDWFAMFNSMVSLSTTPILDHAKSNDGSLPTTEVADTLLKNVKREFDFTYKFGNILGTGDDDDKPVKVKFMIERYGYETDEKDRFTIAYSWSCDSIPLSKGSDSKAKDKMTGNFKIEFTTSGLMVLKRVKGTASDPVEEVLEVYMKRSDQLKGQSVESSRDSKTSKSEKSTT